MLVRQKPSAPISRPTNREMCEHTGADMNNIGRAVVLFVGSASMILASTISAWGQSAGLPPTPPTAGAGASGSAYPGGPSGTSGLPTRAAPAKQRAVVIVTQDRLEVRAQNSSLNGILQEIAAQTGMTISGGVVDQRVFGDYGPGPAPEVISELLQDTGTNMILRMTATGGLGELMLSPRMGGPTPPGPGSFHEEDGPAQASGPPAPTQTPRATPGQTLPPSPSSRPARPPAATDLSRTPVTPDPSGFVSAPTVAPATEPGTTPGPATQSTGTTDQNSGPGSGPGTTNPQSPNGVKTPQQIFEELQKLQQQQQKPPGN